MTSDRTPAPRNRALLILSVLVMGLGAVGLWRVLGRDDAGAPPPIPAPDADPSGADAAELAGGPAVDADAAEAGGRAPVAPDLDEPDRPRVLAVDLDGRPVAGLDLGADATPLRGIYDLETAPQVLPLGTTDAAGRLLAPRVPPGPVTLVSLDPAWLTVGRTTLEAPWTGTVVLRVRPGSGVVGRVVGADGPIAGATVGALVTTTLFDLESDEGLTPGVFDRANVRVVATDAEGRFRLPGLLPTSSRLDVLAPGHRPLQVRFEGPAEGEVRDLGDLHPEPGGWTTFRVSVGGRPAPGARLYLEASDDGYVRGNGGSVADEHGEVRLEGVPPGRYRWVVGLEGTVGHVGSVRVEAGVDPAPLEVPLPVPFRLTVRDTDGAPVEGFTARVLQRHGRGRELRGDGTLELQRPADTPFRVSVTAPGFVPAPRAEVAADVDALEVVLERPGALALTVTGAEGLDALPLGTLPDGADGLEFLDQGLSPVPLEPVPLREGVVRVEGLPPGPTHVVLDLGAGPLLRGPFEVREGATTEAALALPAVEVRELEVRERGTERPLAGVAVRVTTPAGAGAALHRLLGGLTGQGAPTAVSDADGRFRLPVWSGREVHLMLEHRGHRARTVPWAPGEVPVLHLDPVPGLALRVEQPAGTPVAGARVERSALAGDPSGGSLGGSPGGPAGAPPAGPPTGLVTGRTDGTGRVRLDGVGREPARVAVLHDDASGARVRTRARVEPGPGTGEVLLVLLPERATVRLGALPFAGAPDALRVRAGVEPDASAPPAARAQERTWRPDDAHPDPPAELPVPPGPCRVELVRGDDTWTASATLAPGQTWAPDWTRPTGVLRVEVLGAGWSAATVDVRLRSGDQEGRRETLAPTAGEPAAGLDDLAAGEARVVLEELVLDDGTTWSVREGRTCEVGSRPADVRFDVGLLEPLELRVEDAGGRPLSGTSVACLLEGDGQAGARSARTDAHGLARVLLPPGEVLLRVEPPGLPVRLERLPEDRGGAWTVVCPGGGDLVLELPADDDVRDWTLVVLPDPIPASTLEASLAGQALDRLPRTPEDPEPGGEVRVTDAPPGTYRVLAVRPDGEVAASGTARVESGGTARLELGS